MFKLLKYFTFIFILDYFLYLINVNLPISLYSLSYSYRYPCSCMLFSTFPSSITTGHPTTFSPMLDDYILVLDSVDYMPSVDR